MPKVSVIIPVYGVEKSIERCARSLFDQTLDDIEYIFIDDCTPDMSIEILKDTLSYYPNRKEQTKIVAHKKNQGLPKARLTGIKNATGDYIIHCDSDDWVNINMYRTMYEQAIKENADLVVCDYISSDGINEKKMTGLFSKDKEQIILDLLYQRNAWAVWNKLFKRKVYNNEINYPKDNMAEDMVFTMQLIYYCDKIAYVNEALYYYYQNPSSITKVVFPSAIFETFVQACNNAKIIDKFYNKKYINKRLKKGLVYMKFKQRNLLLPVLKDKKYFMEWLKAFPEINGRMLFCSNISLLEKVKFILTFFRLYPL